MGNTLTNRQPKHIGYKNAHGYIIKLEILGENNEDRHNVEDWRYAKFRCQKAKVLEIYHPTRTTRKKTIHSSWDRKFKYTIGEIVEVNDYNPTKSIICGSGIHYYLTEIAAISHGGLPHNYTGTIIEASDNGGLFSKTQFIHGRPSLKHRHH